MHSGRRLLAAALPALAGSVLLMRQADAGAALLTQQITVALVCLGAVALTRRETPRTALGACAFTWH